MARRSHLEELADTIRAQGVYSVSRRSGVKPRLVRDFLRTMDMPVSRWARILHGLDMEVGALHVVDRETGTCCDCGLGDEAHQPLFPPGSDG